MSAGAFPWAQTNPIAWHYPVYSPNKFYRYRHHWFHLKIQIEISEVICPYLAFKQQNQDSNSVFQSFQDIWPHHTALVLLFVSSSLQSTGNCQCFPLLKRQSHTQSQEADSIFQGPVEVTVPFLLWSAGIFSSSDPLLTRLLVYFTLLEHGHVDILVLLTVLLCP